MPGPTDTEVVETPVATEAPDRREVIAQALEASEVAHSQATAPPPPPAEKLSTEKQPAEKQAVVQAPTEPAVKQPTEPAEKQPTEPSTPEQLAIDKPPQAWRAPQRAQWDKLPPDVRQEVIRREREVSKAFGDSAQARQFAGQFSQIVQPYAARLQSLGAHPLVAVQELLKADYLLSSAPMPKRAELMAKLIKDYGVDVVALDHALAGTPQADPVASQVEQLLQQRLAPFQQYMQQQQQLAQLQSQLQDQQIGQTIEQMASNPKYPHFEDLKEDMADLIEVSSKRGVYLTLEDAYTRATAMNPEVSKQVAAQQQAEAQRATVQRQNAAAQKALAASVSVSGSPSGLPGASPAGGATRRQAIEAAFEAIEGR